MICCFVVVVVGCATAGKRSNEAVTDDSQKVPQLKGLDAAMIEAICHLLNETPELNRYYKQKGGTFFFENIKPETVEVIKHRFEGKLPKCSTDIIYYHLFQDVRSRKSARCIVVNTKPCDSELVEFAIADICGDTSGATFVVQVRFANGTWCVLQFRKTGVS
jgi:hypothetical protein